ncbi:zinc finger protein 354C-like isoform X2 [Aricia agestis]|uniref:zinc finger protein 354C-like isoform X2 n=1 Tax=Aricia agestis TaxID=91739 RepID=UPI001C2096CE|nr:zinc finger protein 354C-like isoform X2 [Aricia agestis]
MDDLCITCLSAGRNLIYIGGTELQQIYLQILNEPVTKMLESYLQICWECQAILNRFQQFKTQTQSCYAELWNHVQQGLTPLHSLVKTPCLKMYSVVNIHITDKNGEEGTHFEPETFADELKLKKKKKVSKKSVELKKKMRHKVKKEKVKKEPIKPASDKSDDEDLIVNDFMEDNDEEKPLSEIGGNLVEVEFEPQVEQNTEELKVVKENGVTKTKTREVLPDKPQCVECGKMFSSRKTYRYHMNVLHKGQNRWPCPRCGKVYQWKSNLARHLRSHKALDSGELYCDICDKKFASVATFRQHLRGSRRHVSENDFSFMCNECGKKFVNKTRLRDHIDWEHLNNIKFKCQFCEKPFKCHTSLYVHLQNVHKNREKKDNLCHVCGKSYQNAAKLRYHIVAMHTTETPYRCERCGAAFGWYSSLYRHVREVHHKMKMEPKKCKKTKKLDDLPTLLLPQ